MAKKKNAGRQNITLECVEQRAMMKQGNTDNKGVSRYVTQKNKKNTSERLELRKYNSFLRRHTVHKEIK